MKCLYRPFADFYLIVCLFVTEPWEVLKNIRYGCEFVVRLMYVTVSDSVVYI